MQEETFTTVLFEAIKIHITEVL